MTIFFKTDLIVVFQINLMNKIVYCRQNCVVFILVYQQIENEKCTLILITVRRQCEFKEKKLCHKRNLFNCKHSPPLEKHTIYTYLAFYIQKFPEIRL